MAHVTPKHDDGPRLKAPDPVLSTAYLQIDRAGWAARKFARYSRDAVLKIAEALAVCIDETAGEYAEWAVRETGFGVVEHKKLKNELTGWPLLDHYRDLDLITPRIIADKKMVEFPKPAGVVMALTPATNPISTLNYKVMLAVLSRNVIIISPHPMAAKSSFDAAQRLEAAARAAGAPSGLIQCVETPSIPVVQALMASPKIALIMATGGGPMVRAAYSSSNPAFGVGPGNAPVFIHPSADQQQAAQYIVESKSFDNSVLCTNESVLITLKANHNRFEVALRQAGAHICNKDDVVKLRDYVFPDGNFNLKTLGRSAVDVAKGAGIKVTANTKVLVAPVAGVGPDEVLTREKLCPVLALISVESEEQAISASQIILRGRGAGHSASFHGKEAQIAARYAASLPVYRVVVNAPCSQGAAGFATHLPPSFMIGTGYLGRSSIGENVGPQHLVHWTRLAYNKDAEFGDYSTIELDYLDGDDRPQTRPDIMRPNAGQSQFSVVDDHSKPSPAATIGEEETRKMLRQLILEELQDISRDKS